MLLVVNGIRSSCESNVTVNGEINGDAGEDSIIIGIGCCCACWGVDDERKPNRRWNSDGRFVSDEVFGFFVGIIERLGVVGVLEWRTFGLIKGELGTDEPADAGCK